MLKFEQQLPHVSRGALAREKDEVVALEAKGQSIAGRSDFGGDACNAHKEFIARSMSEYVVEPSKGCSPEF